MMMQPTHFWDFPDRAHLWPLDRPWHRTIHGQTPVRAPVIVVLKVLCQESHEMSFVQNDHGSCTSWLRVIRLIQEAGTMAPMTP
jgi:hypothetical protein